MRCGYCGREIPDQVDATRMRCGKCPGGCRKIHCPHCGYENPAPPDFLKRWLKRDDDRKKE
ncbi:MAG: hypothetical protein P8Z70_01185 [Desulfuromonadales bacterium]